uniref:RDR3 n=1 Tax=Arundo donax TaxID=35708 RepID=A0A0A9D5A5_ARUDO
MQYFSLLLDDDRWLMRWPIVILMATCTGSREIICYAPGISSDCWLAYMDRFLTDKVDDDEKKLIWKKIIKLVDLYYLALDGNKVNSNLALVQFVVFAYFDMGLGVHAVMHFVSFVFFNI